MILVLNIILFAIAWILIKVIVRKLPWRAQALSLQFLLCAILIYLYSLAVGNFHLTRDALLVVPIGFLVSFGAYCQWRAIDLSMSRTALFFPLGSVLTIVLAGIFLQELAKWNPMLTGGMALSFFAIFLFLKSSKTKKKNNQKEKSFKQWLFFASVMIIILGTAVFMRKVLDYIPLLQWLTYWYTGAFLGSLPLLYLEKQNPFKFPGKLIFLVPLVSLAILGHLATQFWAIDLTLISRVESFRVVGIIFLPVLIGWFIFKERKGLSKREGLAFLIGTAGALLIIFS